MTGTAEVRKLVWVEVPRTALCAGEAVCELIVSAKADVEQIKGIIINPARRPPTHSSG
jgi:hypothetical protein